MISFVFVDWMVDAALVALEEMEGYWEVLDRYFSIVSESYHQ